MKYNISARLFGNDTILHLRQRVFNVVILMGIIMSFSASLFNYVLGLGTVTVIVPFLCGVVTIGLYMFYIIGRHYELSALLVVIMLSFIFFPTMWFINAGTYGSIPYYMIINAGIIALLLEGLKRWVIFALYMVFVGILIVIEYRVPEIILKEPVRKVCRITFPRWCQVLKG